MEDGIDDLWQVARNAVEEVWAKKAKSQEVDVERI
jgi:hypothetical protein